MDSESQSKISFKITKASIYTVMCYLGDEQITSPGSQFDIPVIHGPADFLYTKVLNKEEAFEDGELKKGESIEREIVISAIDEHINPC